MASANSRTWWLDLDDDCVSRHEIAINHVTIIQLNRYTKPDPQPKAWPGQLTRRTPSSAMMTSLAAATLLFESIDTSARPGGPILLREYVD